MRATVLVAMLTGLLTAPTGVRALLVTRAVLRLAAAGEQSGVIELHLLLTAADAGERFEANLLQGDVSLAVTDDRGFRANITVAGCRPSSMSSAIACNAAGRRLLVNVRRRSAGPFVYQMELAARGLAATGGGQSLPAVPLRIVLQQPGRPDRLRVVDDCRRGTSQGLLLCRGRARPNLLVILTDDQRPETLDAMPNVLHLLADRGVTFSNAFVTTPLCCPSRASLLTGQYARHTGVLTNFPPRGGAPRFVGRDASTIATWLQAAGYHTGIYGKYLNAYDLQCPPHQPSCYQPPGWDEWHVFVDQSYYDYQLAENGRINAYGEASSDYSTDQLAAQAVQFISSADGRPFFLLVATHAPHAEGYVWAVPAARHQDAFASLTPWRPPSYDEADVSDKPPWVQSLPRAADLLGPGSLFTVAWWIDTSRRAQLQALLAVDEAVAAMVAALRATGQDDDTVIVFTSDNGIAWGEHRWSSKLCEYEACLRVPLIIRDPWLSTGSRLESRLALNIDLAPTLAALAHVTPATTVDGTSLLPLLEGRAAEWRRDFVLEQWDGAGAPAPPDYVGLRTEEWKLVEYPHTGETQLYDLQVDVDELGNVAADPAYGPTEAVLQSALSSRLDDDGRAAGDRRVSGSSGTDTTP